MADDDDERRIREDERRRVLEEQAQRDRADRDDVDERRRSLAGLAAAQPDQRPDGVEPLPTTAVAPTPVERTTAELPHVATQPTWDDPAMVDVVHEDTITERGFSPGQVLIALAGVAFLGLGIAAIARTGLQGSLSEPVEPVLGWNHTALLGLFEIGVGAVMVLGSLRAGARWLGALAGIAAIVGGVLIVGELDFATTDLGAERDFGWVPIALGAAALIGAAVPRLRRTRRVTTTRSR